MVLSDLEKIKEWGSFLDGTKKKLIVKFANLTKLVDH